ncbi:hypothetical protein Ocin01_06971 [Orchesella cincta]|uniref:Uncharacterized protein n=1 Tax=Orchesella cincta TaxID=48709 RepID=A0A1D2N399_ORCCI|nr:hypothetical protein Ocin01_06971 [Orchesella cincta]
MSSKISILITAIVVGLAVYTTAQKLQSIRFFVSPTCVQATSGFPYHNYSASRNITSDVTGTGLQSYCVVRGAWRVEHSYLLHETDFNISLGDSCTTCYRARIGFRYGNIRFLGGQDLAVPAFSLYSDRNFAGKETLISGNEYSFEQTTSFMSYAFNSYSNWTWQTFQQPRYRGNSTCIRPNVVDDVTLVSLTTFNIGSLRLGCRNSANSPKSQTVGLTIAFVSAAIMVPFVGIIL